MTLPICIPQTPSPATSPPSDDSQNNNNNNNIQNNNTTDSVPPTPVSPTIQQKRKPSRRANTAERRATHNAVERQRRETLNSRFLDLAALLPNLSQIRRPSKSSIVNSSIAHIHASRRHRLLAARELRLLKLEADALRRELNEWRERSGIARVEEPVRGDGFGVVLSAELEVIVGQDMEEEEDDELLGPQDVHPHHQSNGGNHNNNQMWDAGDIDDFGIDGMDVPPPSTVDEHDARMLAMLKTHGPAHAGGHPFTHNPNTILPPSTLPHILPRPGATNVPAFEPLYEHPHSQQIHLIQHQQQHQQQQQQQQYLQHQQHQRQQEHEKMWGLYNQNPSRMTAAQAQFTGPQQPPYNNQYVNTNNGNNQQQQMMIQAQRSLFTPPTTSHGLPSPTTSTGPPVSLPSLHTGTNNASISPSPPVSDTAQRLTRQRSGSVHSIQSHASSHSHSHSRGSHSPSYELGLGLGVGVDYMNVGVGVGVGVGVDPYGVGTPRMMGDISLASPVSAGGGGNGGGFAMMM